MTAQELINPLIPVIKAEDPVQKVLDLMEDLRLGQLVVIDAEEKLMGIADEQQLLDCPDPAQPLGQLPLRPIQARIKGNTHLLEVLKQVQSHQLEIIPVTDEEEHLLGLATLRDLLGYITKSYALQQEGGILVLQMSQNDYSLSEISRLVESNNGKILKAYVEPAADNIYKVNVTLKINQKDLTYIIATFERFNYHILAKFQVTDLENLNQDRLGLLLKYIDM
jgi:CBS domain-containing protein